ncbi:MAG: gliding motility-associated C-terminal domain-containing protein [Flavobacteriales bacterium]|nr:gliding motility-associated C-terminal domain-containing protein [Flavobacteriales bacterium]
MRIFRTALLMLLLALAARLSGQCPVTLSSFPYVEGFESGPSWVAGGTSSDWAWGAPTKPVITSAGGGNNAWVVGGLTGSFYNYGEQSWLEGPCFDFSALPFPYVSFRIFWECERTYDGLGFQYSLDQGLTWSNVGSVNDPPSCFNQHWFNTANINNLNLANPKQGWSGRIGTTQGSCAGGQGSAGWVTASHCLGFLAGEPSVKFRFVFGAGTTCNSYDGIAIDDVYIGEAPEEPTAIQFECFSNELYIEDVQTCSTEWLWDFGDPASGAGNTSDLLAPSHVFSGPGSYTVTFTRFFDCRSPQVTTIVLTILGLEVNATQPTCAGGDGALEAIVTNATGPLSFLWNPVGGIASSISGLDAGTYNLNVTGGSGTCPTGAIVTLDPPPAAPTVSANATAASCSGFSDGAVTAIVSAGTAPFAFAWSPSGGSNATASGLVAGTYTCTVTDANGCNASASATVMEPPPLTISAGDTVSICLGDSITLSANASGGTPGFAYAWSPNGPQVSPSVSTSYSVIATDANGCASAPVVTQVEVGDAGTPTFTVIDTLGCTPLCASFIADADDGEFIWEMGDGTVISDGPSIRHCYSSGGVFDVRLTRADASGCSGTWTFAEAVHAIQSPTAAFNAVPPVTTVKEPLIQFINRSTGADSVLWSFGDPSDSTSASYDAEFAYHVVGCYPVQLLVTNAEGCSSTTALEVCVEAEFGVYIPNAFTPNGDGYNDLWGAITTVGRPREFELVVFDRWGGELYRADEKQAFWDGTAAGQVPQGVYPWMLRMRDTEGKVQQRTGHVTLLR